MERRTNLLPIRFTYMNNGLKVYLSILSQCKHHFTGEKMLYVREEGENGWVEERWYSRPEVLTKLETRVEEN